MPAFRLTEAAKEDLRSIGRYTQTRWGREQRNLYLANLDASFHLLAKEPQRGRRVHPDFAMSTNAQQPNLRKSRTFKSYLKLGLARLGCTQLAKLLA